MSEPTPETPTPLTDRAVEVEKLAEELAKKRAKLAQIDEEHAAARAPLADDVDYLAAALEAQVAAVRTILAIVSSS